MGIINRNAIFAALFAQVKANLKLEWVTVSRNYRNHSDLTSANMPALFQVDGIVYQVSQLDSMAAYGAARYVLQAHLWIYGMTSQDKNPNAIPSAILNDLIDDVEGSLATPYPGERQMLGGLVENAFVDGEGYQDPGIGATGKLIGMVPVKMILGI